jgi:hypothetical protein
MSSSDPALDKATESKEIGGEEDLDSIDASLDAILSEAKDVAPAEVAPLTAEGSSPAEEADTVIPPPADIQLSLSETATGSDVVRDSDGAETPLPVIVEDEEPSYKAFANMVAPPEEPKIELPTLEAAPPAEVSVSVTALSEEPESGEILDADALIDSMTPAPEPAAIEAAEAAAAELARTEESRAFPPPTPPSDEEILEQVKLPPGATPMPLVATTGSSEVPGSALGDDDQTVISPMPPIPEPAVLPPPPRFGSAWASPPADLTPSILLTREGLGTKIRKVAASRVQTSVATMAIVVIGSCALGAAVMRAAAPAAPAAPATPMIVAGPAPAKAEPAHAPAIAPLPATPAPAEPVKAAPVVAEKTEKAEKPAAAKPAPAKAKPAAPRETHIALAAPAAAKPAPGKAKPTAPAKPKKAAQGNNWVDPFGQ